MIPTTWLAASVAALLSVSTQIQTQATNPGPPPAAPSPGVHPGPTTQPKAPPPNTAPGPVLGPRTPPTQTTAAVQAGAVAPPDQQLAQARKMVELFTQAEQTMQALHQAEQKLSAQPTAPLSAPDKTQLTASIQSAIAQLEQIRQSVPYNDLQQALYRTTAQLQAKQKLPASALQPLASAVQANRIYLQPQLIGSVGEAQGSLQAGDEQRAALDLKTASDALYNDVALHPIDQSLDNLAAAQKSLQGNNTAQLLKQLKAANQIDEKLKLEGPLVPVRFELRAAADAAGNQKHQEAQTLVQDAGDQLRHLRGTIGTWQLRAQLDPLIQKVANLRAELDAGKTPSPADIQQVAQQATAFQYNEGAGK